MKLTALFLIYASPAWSQWVMATATNPAVRAIAPDVHSVRTDEQFVYVESAGLSLHSFGALEANQYDAPKGPRTFAFRLPRNPRRAEAPVNTPPGVIGVFATGVPIYNPIGTNSYQNQNIWHQDAVAAAAAQVGTSPLVANLNTGNGQPSPMIGFALDGFPIYGPYGPNGRKMRSGYRLRSITKRTSLPDGTLLTPGEEGPDVSTAFPLGYFAEDYEYAPAAGDLDEHNGAAVNGSYGYFMTQTWPYLVGPAYYGDAALEAPARTQRRRQDQVDLWMDRAEVKTGEAVNLTFQFHDAKGRAVRFLESVHERPVHLIVVSQDLAEFDHIHPLPVAGDALAVEHTFARAGDYWLYADYTVPGEAPSVTRFALKVTGDAGTHTKLPCDPQVSVKFDAPSQVRAGADVPLSFTLTNPANGQPVTDLEPWLGAWAHIMLVSQDGASFIHAHPLEAAALQDPLAPHTHTAPVTGPSPATIRTVTGFKSPGTYRLWFQFQRNGEVNAVSFLVKVAAGDQVPAPAAAPKDAISVKVSSAGFTPARIEVPAGKPVRIAFTRTDAQNCAGEVVFASVGLRKTLPVGQTVLVELPARASGQIGFACGMGMYRGAVVIQ